MKVLFISGVYPQEETILKSKIRNGSLQYAPNEFQWRLIEGFMENKADIYVISMPFLPCFPNYKSIYTNNQPLVYEGNKIGEFLSYCSIPIIKEQSQKYRLRKRVKEFIKTYKDEKIVIITYNCIGYMQMAIRPLKKHYNNVKIVSLITDLVDDSSHLIYPSSFAKYVQAKLELRNIKKSYNYTDGFILLSKHMVEKIPQAINKNIVVEGISKSYVPDNLVLKSGNEKSIIYTGALSKYSGVENLIKAFMATNNESYRLIICGNGDLKEYIIKNSEKDHRIIYKGEVKHDEAIKLQKECTIVINPRLPSTLLTKYSFPSKTIEYLLSGTPMIGYKLDGIPEEYYDYIYSPQDESTESLTQLIDIVLSKNSKELQDQATKAKDFILEHKTAKRQVYKILSFINKF